MATGDRVDWGGDAWGQSKRLSKSSFSGLLGGDKSPRSKKSNKGDNGYVSRGGGSASQRTAAGLSGLKKTLVDRRVNTAKNKNNQITKGGGITSRAVVQAKPASVRVKPEN